MKTSIRAVGGSRGIIIPKAIMKQLNLDKSVDMTVENNAIVLRPSFAHPRAGWAEAIAKEIALNGPYELTEEDLAWMAFPNEADKDLVW